MELDIDLMTLIFYAFSLYKIYVPSNWLCYLNLRSPRPSEFPNDVFQLKIFSVLYTTMCDFLWLWLSHLVIATFGCIRIRSHLGEGFSQMLNPKSKRCSIKAYLEWNQCAPLLYLSQKQSLPPKVKNMILILLSLLLLLLFRDVAPCQLNAIFCCM